MKTIRITALLFCLYTIISKAIAWWIATKIVRPLNEDEADKFIRSFDHLEAQWQLIWSIAFFLLIFIWFYALIKRSEKLKNACVVLTLVFALGMSITDNMKPKMYFSNIHVGSEKLS